MSETGRNTRPREINGKREQTGDEKKNSPVSNKVIH